MQSLTFKPPFQILDVGLVGNRGNGRAQSAALLSGRVRVRRERGASVRTTIVGLELRYTSPAKRVKLPLHVPVPQTFSEAG
jgi:hypothetical protein